MVNGWKKGVPMEISLIEKQSLRRNEASVELEPRRSQEKKSLKIT